METSLSATRAVTWVRTSAVFAPRLYPNASLYQDRLGTNIGKAQKGGAFFAGITNAIYGNRTMLRAAAALAAAQRAAAAAQPPATAVQQLRLKQAMLNVLWCGTRPFQKSYFILKPEHFKQDRLGANIGKAINSMTEAFSRRVILLRWDGLQQFAATNAIPWPLPPTKAAAYDDFATG
jgi:hypothetical protein